MRKIEGRELDVLKKLIESGTQLICYFQVQFLDVVKEAVVKSEKITSPLKNTQRQSWSYCFISESS
jgi:hypothetical protein